MEGDLLARLRARLAYYEELGFTPLQRPRKSPGSVTRPEEPVAEIEASPPGQGIPESSTMPPVDRTAPRALSLFGEAPGRIPGDTLERIQADLGDCRRCKLWPHRTHIVFGSGNPEAELVFVGEAPGEEEDRQALPFVGRAGQLLTHWIESLGLKRSDVYICNVIKCRPPGNRSPEKDEIETCSQFLSRQLDVLQPKLICVLGSVALQTLLGKNVSITRFRGQFTDYRGMKLFATFHPAYLLRNPNANREVQQDLRKIRTFLGLPASGRRASPSDTHA
ncbi:MAG: uracil-DNA glycosylase [Acidobacteria bacterium]|nr:uracil-DNA glycosylase [Acidobacteriota bacterium]